VEVFVDERGNSGRPVVLFDWEECHAATAASNLVGPDGEDCFKGDDAKALQCPFRLPVAGTYRLYRAIGRPASGPSKFQVQLADEVIFAHSHAFVGSAAV